MKYKIIVNPHVDKILKKIDISTARKMRNKIRDLAEDPRSVNSKKMKGESLTYRLCVGDYRIVYEIQDKKLIIIVVNVGHRKNVYKRR